jgi:hypothetical protein
VLPEGFTAPVELVTISVTSGPVAASVSSVPVQWVVYLVYKCTSCTSGASVVVVPVISRACAGDTPTIETIGTTDKKGDHHNSETKGAIGKTARIYSQNQVFAVTP